jgi:hypothetical protein
MSGFPLTRDLAAARTLLGGTRYAFLGVPDLYVQGSGPNDASWGVLSFLATWCL